MDTTTPATTAPLTHTDAVERLVGPDNIGTLDDRQIIHSTDLYTDGDTTTCLQLMLTHSKESKCFTARLMVVGLIDRGAYTVTVSTPFVTSRSKRLPPKAVSRFSEKALIAYRDETAALLKADPSWLDTLDLNPWPGTPDPAAGGLSAIAKF